MEKRCPRCGKAFECKHGTPELCQCTGIPLSAETRIYLRTHYKDCLCAECLRELGV